MHGMHRLNRKAPVRNRFSCKQRSAFRTSCILIYKSILAQEEKSGNRAYPETCPRCACFLSFHPIEWGGYPEMIFMIGLLQCGSALELGKVGDGGVGMDAML